MKKINFLDIIYVIIKLSLIIFVILLKDKWLFNENIYYAILYLIFNILIIGSSIYCLIRFKNIKNIIYKIISFILITFGVIFSIYGVRAIIYSNSNEVYILNKEYSLKEARNFRDELHKIFNYKNKEKVRDVLINSYFLEDDKQVIYISDKDNNYKLKLFVKYEDKFIDIYYMIDEENKIYLYKDGVKSKKFEYYYGIYLLNEFLGEEVSDRTILDDVQEYIKNISKDNDSNIFSYEELVYDSNSDSFSLKAIFTMTDGKIGYLDKYCLIKFSDGENNSKNFYVDKAFENIVFEAKFGIICE